MDSEQVIKEASLYIDEQERAYNRLGPFMAWSLIVLGLIIFGTSLYQRVHYHEKLQTAIAELNKSLNEHEGNDLLSKAIDAKIGAAITDHKLSSPIDTWVSAMFFVSGITLLFLQKSFKRRIILMRGLLKLVHKNS